MTGPTAELIENFRPDTLDDHEACHRLVETLAERLTETERERVRQNEAWKFLCARLTKERNALRAENERLRRAMKPMLDYIAGTDLRNMVPPSIWDDFRAALAKDSTKGERE